MHISLDSELGRPPRLIGQSVFQIAPNAAAAYSLRSLTGGDPKVVRVRRSSDNSEEDFNVSEVNSGALVDFVGSGNDGFVDTWYDQSGNNNHADDHAADRQPKIVISGSLVKDANGHPEINFDAGGGGGHQYLEKTAYTQGDLAQANTIFSIAKLDTAQDANRKLYDGTASTKRNALFLHTTGDGQFVFFADDIVATGVTATNDKNLFSAVFNGASSKLFINGTEAAAGDVGDYPMSGIIIGKNNVNFQNFWIGQIQEIIVYNSDQSSNRSALETNINDHYGIYS